MIRKSIYLCFRRQLTHTTSDQTCESVTRLLYSNGDTEWLLHLFRYYDSIPVNCESTYPSRGKSKTDHLSVYLFSYGAISIRFHISSPTPTPIPGLTYIQSAVKHAHSANIFFSHTHTHTHYINFLTKHGRTFELLVSYDHNTTKQHIHTRTK